MLSSKRTKYAHNRERISGSRAQGKGCHNTRQRWRRRKGLAVMTVRNDGLLSSQIGRLGVAEDGTTLAQGRAGLAEGGGAQGDERVLFCETWG
jgi:hypothetical protein